MVEAAAALALLLLAGSRRLAGPGRAFARWAGRRAAAPGRTLALFFLLGTGVTGISYLLWGPPIPKVTDELGHLLVADTWQHGRLANAGHPMWRHFDIYALQFPHYASKYPPGQGALLALGRLLGAPALGPCLGAGWLAAAMAWAFFRWLRPRWAFCGGLLVLLRLAIGSYWHQSYWGGTVGAVGGALLFGALAPGRRPRPGWAALGLALLAASRPFEGLLVALPCAWVLLGHFRGLLPREGPRAARELLAMLLILVPAAAGLAYANWRITGDPLLFPQAGYVTAYSATPDLVFQRPFGEFAGQQIRAPIRASRLAATLPPGPPSRWLPTFAAAVPARLARSLFFYLGVAGSLAFLLGLATPGAKRNLALALFAVSTVGQGLPTFYFPHHAAPLAFIFYFFALAGLRRAALSRWPAGPARGRRPGYRLVLLLLGAELLATGCRFPGLRPEPGDASRQREAMAARLAALPGEHLVIVEPRSMTDWVWNGAEIDAQKVVWARTDGAAADARLRDYYRGREVWRARLDVEPPLLESLPALPPAPADLRVQSKSPLASP